MCHMGINQSINQHHKNVKIPSPWGCSVYTIGHKDVLSLRVQECNYVYVHAGCNNNNNTIIFLALESITTPLPGSSPGPPSFYLSHHYPFH